ncbi:MAG: hypothetical protein AAFX76_02515 [Planctomycetota bacterium]
MLELPLMVTYLLTVQLPSPPPPLRFAPDTTVIAGPARPDGTPDYAAYLNERFGVGVEPQTNFAVDLFATMSVERFGDDFDPIARLTSMGVDDPEARFDPLPELPDTIFFLPSVPWTAADHPDEARWLADHAGLLDRLAEATRKPHYFVPFTNGADEPLIGTLLPHLGHGRSIARLWRARAMHRLGEGDPEAAWADNLAAYRLGRHMRRGVLIDHLVGISIEALSNGLLEELLASPDLTPAMARRMAQDLAALPPVRPLTETYEFHERFGSLDAMVFAISKPDALRDLGLGDIAAINRVAPLRGLDLNVILRRVNRHYDELERVSRLEDPLEKIAAIERWDESIEAVRQHTQQVMFRPEVMAVVTHGPRPLSRWAVSHFVGDLLTGILLPALGAANRTEDQARQVTAIAPVAIAVAGYRAEHGNYPEALDDLVPDWLDAVPIDGYSGEPLRYVVIDGRPVIYSVGPDLEDDGGVANERKEEDSGLVIGGDPEDEVIEDTPAGQGFGAPAAYGAQ